MFETRVDRRAPRSRAGAGPQHSGGVDGQMDLMMPSGSELALRTTAVGVLSTSQCLMEKH